MNSAALTVALFVTTLPAGDGLTVHLRNNDISVSAARLEVIRDPVLTRLKSGSSVAFDFHLALWSGTRSNLRRRAFERFVVSYDLWEEKYAVTGLRKPRISATRLSPEAVGPWCLQQIKLANIDLTRDERVWVRLDVRAVDPKQDADLFGADGVSLVNLIELLSRPAKRDNLRWTLESGALRVSELKP